MPPSAAASKPKGITEYSASLTIRQKNSPAFSKNSARLSFLSSRYTVTTPPSMSNR